MSRARRQFRGSQMLKCRQIFLKLPDSDAECWLTDMTAPRRTAEVLLLRQRGEVAKFRQSH
jgi:hypothetical protein